MPWTGPYTFTRDNSAFTGDLVWTDDRDAGTKITAAHHDFHDQDIADGFALCLRNDGVGGPTADMPWNSHKLTGLGTPSANTDAAQYGQTPDTMDLDAGTNVLTLTLQNGDTVTVDLSALAVGGSTADFARLSATQTFAGINTFSQAPVSPAGFSITPTAGNVSLWRIAADTAATFRVLFSGTYTGTALQFNATGNNAGTLSVCGSTVWTQANLTPATIANLLTPSSNATITGAWTFTNPALKLVGFQWSAATGGGNWTAGPDSGTQLSFTDPTGLAPLIYVIDSAPVAGGYLQIGPDGKRVWDQGSLQPGLTAAPSDSVGEDGNLAAVVSGADKGLWAKVSGSWTKIAS